MSGRVRRAAQDVDLGKESVDVSSTHAALLERDAKDSGRKASPLPWRSDAVVVDTTDLTLDESIDAVVGLVDAAGLASGHGRRRSTRRRGAVPPTSATSPPPPCA